MTTPANRQIYDLLCSMSRAYVRLGNAQQTESLEGLKEAEREADAAFKAVEIAVATLETLHDHEHASRRDEQKYRALSAGDAQRFPAEVAVRIEDQCLMYEQKRGATAVSYNKHFGHTPLAVLLTNPKPTDDAQGDDGLSAGGQNEFYKKLCIAAQPVDSEPSESDVDGLAKLMRALAGDEYNSRIDPVTWQQPDYDGAARNFLARLSERRQGVMLEQVEKAMRQELNEWADPEAKNIVHRANADILSRLLAVQRHSIEQVSE